MDGFLLESSRPLNRDTDYFFFRMLQRAKETDYININCIDPLGRSALLMAIDNENLEMVEILIEYKVEKDIFLYGNIHLPSSGGDQRRSSSRH